MKVRVLALDYGWTTFALSRGLQLADAVVAENGAVVALSACESRSLRLAPSSRFDRLRLRVLSPALNTAARSGGHVLNVSECRANVR